MEVFVQNSSIYCIFWLPSVTDRFNPNNQFPDQICYSNTLEIGLETLLLLTTQNKNKMIHQIIMKLMENKNYSSILNLKLRDKF